MYVLPLKEQAHLTTLYTQPHRHYHNLNHVNFCLGLLETCPNIRPLDEVVAVLAVWYHDAVYNPFSSKNEEASADLFLSSGPLRPQSLLSFVTSSVEEAILETAHHTYHHPEPSFTTALMLDLDLASMGQDWQTFEENGKQIRKEYSHIEDGVFNSNRIKFFEQLQKRPSLYYLSFFKDKFETQARANVDNELKRLYTV